MLNDGIGVECSVGCLVESGEKRSSDRLLTLRVVGGRAVESKVPVEMSEVLPMIEDVATV